MNNFEYSPNDPKLTAYALGELQGQEKAEVEAAIRHDPVAQAYVEQTRAFAAELGQALAREQDTDAPSSVEAVAPTPQRAAIIQGPDFRKLDGGGLPEYERGKASILRFPQLYYVIGGLAAACVAVLIVVQPEKSGYEKQYTTVYLNPKAEKSPVPAMEEAAGTGGSGDRQTAVVTMAEGGTKPEGGSAPVPKSAVPDLLDLAKSGALLPHGAGTMAPAIRPSPSIDAMFTAARPRAKVEMPPLGSGRNRGETRGLAAASSGRAGTLATYVAAKSQRDTPVYYYPPDEKFVVPVYPRGSDGVILAVPKPEAPWGMAPKQQTGNTFAFGDRLPNFDRNWSATIGPALKSGKTFGPVFVPGGLDLLPGSPAKQRNLDELIAGFRLESGPAAARNSNEAYAYRRDNPFVSPGASPFSTFAIDVDTASYANVRRFIDSGRLPPADAVRIEELLNYFTYDDRAGSPGDAKSNSPITASLEVADAPWAPSHRLVRIGLKARDISTSERPTANLVFLVDVSGSMDMPAKLPLVKEALRVLVRSLRPDDRIAIVTYAENSGLALPSTPVAKPDTIFAALDGLAAAGATNGERGIQLAYDVAKANFVPGGINRVVLCTDGDFNVGAASEGELTRLVEDKARSGVMLTVLGFGMGNYKDATLELLADKGNGNYGYIDTRGEAEKLLAQQVNGTLMTVAKDVKVQVDFNPARVAQYRLIGYEDRALATQDFNADSVEGGELGAGHAVTALYEIVPVGVEKPKLAAPPVDVSRYAAPIATLAQDVASSELLAVKIRYQDPAGGPSQKLEFPLTDSGQTFANASSDFRFAAAVAEFGMILRDSPYRGSTGLADVVAWAAGAAGDGAGIRNDFVDLARHAQKLMR